jgi:hypothetical protein
MFEATIHKFLVVFMLEFYVFYFMCVFNPFNPFMPSCTFQVYVVWVFNFVLMNKKYFISLGQFMNLIWANLKCVYITCIFYILFVVISCIKFCIICIYKFLVNSTICELNSCTIVFWPNVDSKWWISMYLGWGYDITLRSSTRFGTLVINGIQPNF